MNVQHTAITYHGIGDARARDASVGGWPGTASSLARELRGIRPPYLADRRAEQPVTEA